MRNIFLQRSLRITVICRYNNWGTSKRVSKRHASMDTNPGDWGTGFASVLPPLLQHYGMLCVTFDHINNSYDML